jgi:hypothetical protein
MSDDLVKRYRNSREWLNDGECCGDKNSDGVCAAPACIFGEAVKELQNAADHIEKLENENNDVSIHLEAAMVRIEKLEAALREIAALGVWDGDSAMSIARKALEGRDV